MRASMRARNRYFYEFAIARAINEFNEGASADQTIRVSEGRLLRNAIVEKLDNRPWHTVKGSEFMEAANEVLGKRMGRNQGFGGAETFEEYRVEYSSASGWGRGVDTVDDADHWLPISPYDPDFTYRATMMQNGSEILWANAADLAAIEGPDREPEETFESYLDRADRARGLDDVRYNHEVKLWHRTDKGNREAGKAATTADVVGFSRLAPYMNQADWERAVHTPELFRWASNPENLTEGEVVALQDASERAAAICDYLQNTGREVTYNIDWSSTEPYLQARVAGTGIRVRLTASPGNASHVGRIYDNGLTFNFGASYKSKTVDEDIKSVKLTAEEAVMPLRMALGEDIRTYEADSIPIMNMGSRTQCYTVYSNSTSLRTSLRTLPGNRYNQQLQLRMDRTNRTARTAHFDTVESAEAFLQDAIGSARADVTRRLDAEGLIAAAQADTLEAYEWSADDDVREMQEMLAAHLSGEESRLMRPGQDSAEFIELATAVDASTMTGEVSDESIAEALLTARLAEVSYSEATDLDGAIANVRRFSEDLANAEIGQFEADDAGKRFDADTVALRMEGPNGLFRNRDDIVVACVAAGIQPEELKCGGEFSRILADRLVTFDAESSRSIEEAAQDEPFLGRMGQVIATSLASNGVAVDEMRIDDMGIVQWKGRRRVEEKVGAETPITGTIGQIFAPDAQGAITTAFASGDDYVLVPGYDAYIMRQKPGEHKSVEERTRLLGYEQAMTRALQYQIRQDLAIPKSINEVGTSTHVNRVYRQIPGERYQLDWWREARQGGMDDKLANAIMATQSGRVRYLNAIRDGSTINAEARAERYGTKVDNDNFGDAYVLTGGRNMAILGPERDGYFDPMMTTSDTNQGTTVYLTEGAQVQVDGSIVPGPVGDRAPLAKLPELETMAFDPFNRQQMTYSNIMHSVRMTEANVAQMTFGGWNMEDAVVISREFAEKNPVLGTDGQMRPLMAGDKLSDLHGNKGVVSLVVDREMTDEKALQLGISDQVAWYRANPDLDIVMAPFSAVSRFNGGTAREMMPSAQNLVTPDGKVLEGCMGTARMVITDKTADAATRVYTDADVSDGKGRKVSSQLIWALDAAGCENILSEAFSRGNAKAATVREALLSLGLDMDPYGTLHMGYEAHPGENRQVMEIGELQYDSVGRLLLSRMGNEFGRNLSDAGGFIAMPFDVKACTGEVFSKRESDGRCLVPVMSASMRSGQELSDGETITHDYTNQYTTMYRQAAHWLDLQSKLENTTDESKRTDLLNKIAKCERSAQGACNAIARDVIQKKVQGKHNMFKDVLMSRRMHNSATSIITPDPTLAVDEIAIGRAMAEVLGVKPEGGELLVWRDPILREGGVRYMNVKVSDDICGTAINPVSFQCMDGDFDGDKVGLLRLTTPEAQVEAREKLSFAAKMLEPSYQRSDGMLDLGFNTGLDVQCGMAADASIAGQFDKIREQANGTEDWASRNLLLASVTNAVVDAFDKSCGQQVISYASPEANLASIKAACIDTGAKGSASKLADYAKYLGIELKPGAMDADGNINWDRAEDKGVSLATRKDHENTEAACAIKSFGTGVAGKYSQRGIKALRDKCPRAVLECTKPVTQAVLQAKHDPIAAMRTYQLLQGPVRELWRGHAVKVSKNKDSWVVDRGDDGNPKEVDVETWVNSFVNLYTSSIGMNEKVNPDYVREIALAMAGPDGMVGSVEDMGSISGEASFMDVMAYDGTFDDLCKGAMDGRNLWEGACARMIMPDTIRRNQLARESMAGMSADEVQWAQEAGLAEPVKAVTKSDTQVKVPVERGEAKCSVREVDSSLAQDAEYN